MRKVFIILVFVASSASAQFETWQPWLTEIGITPFLDMYYDVSTSDTIGSYLADSASGTYKPYQIERSGIDLVAGVQANVPPFYVRYGFSNLIGAFSGNNEETCSPFFANLRTGFQFPYQGTIFDLSALIVAKIVGKVGYTALVLETVYFRDVGGFDLFGTLRGGFETTEVPKGEKNKRSEKTIGVSIGGQWHKDFVTPYAGASITYPITEDKVELRWLVSVGVQLSLPYTYVAGLPCISYPRVIKGDFKEGQ